MRQIDEAPRQIGIGIRRTYRDCFGIEPADATVWISEDLVVVIVDVELERTERTLQDEGHAESVCASRDAIAQTVAAEHREIVEQATGRRVCASVSKAFVESSSWEAEVFRLAPVAA